MTCRTSVESLAIFPNGELGITWADGHESYYPARELRLACTCARCMDEVTGRRVLLEDRVPRDVRPLEAIPVGRYAIALRWSDRHETGIYPFERLRQLCPCPECRRTRS